MADVNTSENLEMLAELTNEQLQSLLSSGGNSWFAKSLESQGVGLSDALGQIKSEMTKRKLDAGEKDELETLLSSDPNKLTSEKIADTLARFKGSLLAGTVIGAESQLDSRTQTLLAAGEETAKKLTARLKMTEKSLSNPGLQTQTTVVNKTSLLG